MDDSLAQPRADRSEPRPSRRAVLRGVAAAGAVGAATPLLAACGSDSTAASPSGGSTSTKPSGGGGGGGSASGSASTPLSATSKVPVGGGLVLRRQQVVLTQPARGEFKGFSAICTHAGCVVANVLDGTINCGCHGSQFSIKDGSVVRGPATSPLPSKDVAVTAGEISLA